MKRSITVIAMMVLAIVSLGAGQVRPTLSYFYNTAVDGYPTSAVENPAWGEDTLVLTAILDSNGYTGSCLPYITTITGDTKAPLDVLNAVVGTYRIYKIVITSSSWLKKITSNIGNLLYLGELDIFGCHNLTSISGINKYMTQLDIDSSNISAINCNLSYLKGLAITHDRGLKSFSFALDSIQNLLLQGDSISDISGLTVGAVCKLINLDSNNLYTLPVSLLQDLANKSAKIGIDYNCLSNVSSLLDQVAIDPNWKTTQRIYMSTKIIVKPSESKRPSSSTIYYNFLGRRIPSQVIAKGVYISKVAGLNILIK
jgi:hypothetical protein